ncbi:hypothetical protein Deipe_1951 [Deinococcus peraridilitoris DSM 19664]|uniref:Transmembrane protein n=2 Tax=Deinococcus TaxID=1298 RepID=L0A1X7_DEIPD|nr:hypothetical protein Deipe_1951 [Deinococcus peraridilitoris DSM 19664]
MSTVSQPVKLLTISVILQTLVFVLIFAFGLLPSTWWWMLWILALSVVPSGLRLRDALRGKTSSISPNLLLLLSLILLVAILLRLYQVHAY